MIRAMVFTGSILAALGIAPFLSRATAPIADLVNSTAINIINLVSMISV